MTAPAGTYKAWRLPFEPSMPRVGFSSLNRLPVKHGNALLGQNPEPQPDVSEFFLRTREADSLDGHHNRLFGKGHGLFFGHLRGQSCSQDRGQYVILAKIRKPLVRTPRFPSTLEFRRRGAYPVICSE